MGTLETAVDFSTTYPSGETNTALGSSVPKLADRLDRLEAFGTDLQTVIGTDDVTDAESMEARLVALEAASTALAGTEVYNVDQFPGMHGDGSTDDTASIQALISFFGGFVHVPIRLKFPSKLGYLTGPLDIPYSNIWLEGPGPRVGGLIGNNTVAGGPLLHWHGTDAGNYTGRKEGGGTVNLRLSNTGPSTTSNTVAIFAENMTAMSFFNTAWWAFRGAGSCFKGRNCADSWFFEPEADFCGNISPSRALFDLGANVGGEWACDRIRWWGGRLENNSGPILKATSDTGANKFVTKLYMKWTKVENQLTSTNGTGGDTSTGALFELDTVLASEFDQLDFTVGGLASTMSGTPLPSIFRLTTCYGMRLSGNINVGLPGVKPFTSWFLIDGGCGHTIAFGLENNQTDTGCLPTQVFKFTNSPKEVERSGTYWKFNANSTVHGGAGSEITAAGDSGTIGSLQDGYDDKYLAYLAHTTNAQAHPLAVAAPTATGSISASSRLVAANPTGGDITLTLPAASTWSGQKIVVHNLHATNAVTVTRNGSESMSGKTSIKLTGQFDTLTLWSWAFGVIVESLVDASALADTP
jgi:hypothetical protein